MNKLFALNTISFKENLKKDGFSNNFINKHLWKYHYLLTDIMRASLLRTGETYSIRFHMKTMNQLLSNTEVNGKPFRFSTEILNAFERWSVIIRQRNNESDGDDYKTSVFVKLYDEATENGWEEWIDTEVKPAPNQIFQKPAKVFTGIYKQIADNLGIVTIDAAAAREFMSHALKSKMKLRPKKRGNVSIKNRRMGMREYSAWLYMIEAIENGDYAPAVDADGSGRFYSNLCNTATPLRNFFFIDGLPTHEIDISSSQCLVFAIFLKRKYGSDLPEAVARYIDLCERGEFYNTVKKIVILPGEADMDMPEFKVAFFGKIFYSSEVVNWNWRKRFAAEFPEVSDCITSYKCMSYKDLPAMLTAMEAQIMLHGVTARLFANGITRHFSVHDSFYCTEDVKPTIEQYLIEEFKKYGVTPHFKSKKQ